MLFFHLLELGFFSIECWFYNRHYCFFFSFYNGWKKFLTYFPFIYFFLHCLTSSFNSLLVTSRSWLFLQARFSSFRMHSRSPMKLFSVFLETSFWDLRSESNFLFILWSCSISFWNHEFWNKLESFLGNSNKEITTKSKWIGFLFVEGLKKLFIN